MSARSYSLWPLYDVAVLLAGVAVLFAGCASRPHDGLIGYTLDPPTAVGDLSLPDVSSPDGSRMRLSAADGELLIVYFGYTHCPDVCPTTLADLRSALRQLGSDAKRVQVAMVTVDPGRDTPAVLRGFLQSFVHDGRPLRTDDDDELRRVAERFGASYLVTTDPDGNVEVTHSATTYVVNQRGEVAVAWPFGTHADDIAHDLRVLLRKSSA